MKPKQSYEKGINDAIGNQLILGKEYVYISNINGFSKVRIGILTRVTESRLAILHVTDAFKGLYSDNNTREILGSKTISVKCNLIVSYCR